MARPPKYTKKLVDEIVGFIKADTYSQAEICQMVGITPVTFSKWKSEKEEFAAAIAEAEEARRQNIAMVAKRSLMRKVAGYEFTETKTIMNPPKKDGDKPTVKEVVHTKKFIQPDTAAIIFTLTNVDPENWKNRQTSEVTGKDGKDLFSQKTDEELNAEIEELNRKLKS